MLLVIGLSLPTFLSTPPVIKNGIASRKIKNMSRQLVWKILAVVLVSCCLISFGCADMNSKVSYILLPNVLVTWWLTSYFSRHWELIIKTMNHSPSIRGWNSSRICPVVFAAVVARMIKTLQELWCSWKTLPRWAHLCSCWGTARLSFLRTGREAALFSDCYTTQMT